MYSWFDIGVLDYNADTKLFLVQLCNKKGRIVDQEGKTVINGGILDNGQRMSLPGQWWIPRIRIMFRAEDPRIFADRLAAAFRSRKVCEAELRYNLYIDCMPMDGVGELDQASLKRMIEWAHSAPGFKGKKYVIN